MTRLIVMAVTLLFVVGFGVLTAYSVAEQGVTLGTLVSFAVLVLLGVGVIGALRNPPR
jgi:hypothetical protein